MKNYKIDSYAFWQNRCKQRTKEVYRLMAQINDMKVDLKFLYSLAINYEYPENLEEIRVKWDLGKVRPMISFKAIHQQFGEVDDSNLDL